MPVTDSDSAAAAAPSSNVEWLQRADARLPRTVEQLDAALSGAIPDSGGTGPRTEEPPSTSVRTGWQLGAYVETGNHAESNAYARAEVAGGADALLYRLYQQPDARDIEALLRGIDAERVSLHCTLRYPGQDPAELFRDLVRFLRRGNYDLTKASGSVDFDPLLDWSEPPFPPLIRLLFFVSRWMPGFKVLQVNAAGFNNGVEAADLELALALAKGAQYLAELQKRNYPAILGNRHLQFTLTVGTSFHGDVAKLHALRILWANVQKEFGVEQPRPVQIAAHSDIVTLTGRVEEDLSKLRVQTATAAHGGADLLFLSPATDLFASPTAGGRAIPRGIQHQLRTEGPRPSEESNNAVAVLTEELVRATWVRYRNVQDKGGFSEVVEF